MAASSSASAGITRHRGMTMFPHARDFLAGLRNIAAYGQSQSTLNAAEFKAKFFDSKCENYFTNLFDGSERNAQDRQNIMSVTIPGISSLDQTRKEAICAFSDEFDLNELLCLDYCIASQRNPTLLSQLENADPNKYKGYYDLRDKSKVEAAPRHLYIYERETMMEGLLLLLKMRAETLRLEDEAPESVEGSCYKVVVDMGDALLAKGLCAKLIATIKSRYQRLRERFMQAQKQGRNYAVTFLDTRDFTELQALSTILFYALDGGGAQAEQELQALQGLIFMISKDLTKSNDFLLSMDGAETIHAWQAPAHVILVVLQLVHATVVDTLTDRCFDETPEADRTKDLLFKMIGELYIESNGIGCHSAYGAALLAYAQFVLNFGTEAPTGAHTPAFFELMHQVNEGDACLGTYNYLRLCMLPVLQARSHEPRRRDVFACGAGVLSETAADLFSAFLKVLNALACCCTNSLDRFSDSTACDIGNLFAATFAIKPSYAKEFNPSSDVAHGAFDPFAVQLLHRTMRAAEGKLNTVSIYLLAGLAGGAREAENVYRLLDSTPQAVNPNAVPRLDWDTLLTFLRKCVDYVSKIQEVHEKILVAIFTLMSTVAGRSQAAANALLRDYPSIPLLFQLLAVPVSVTLKGSIFRALTAFARVETISVHEEIWMLIENYRLLPTYGIGKDTSTAVSGLLGGYGAAVSNVRTGLRLELEDSESKEGIYSITDGFLQLLEALLSHNVQDQLGARYRPPGISVYLEYVIEDVLIKAQDRFFILGSQGKAQRWKLVARCLKVLINVLQHYPVNAIEALQVQRMTPGEPSVDEEMLTALEADFREELVSYTINGVLQHDQIRLKSAGFFVMALLLSSTSRLRDQVLQLLHDNHASNLQDSWEQNYEASIKQALKMGEILAQKTRHNSFLDARLSFQGFDGGACDGSYWRGRCVTTATGLLYECSLREKAFMRHARSAPYLNIMRSDNGRSVSTPVTLHPLGDVLAVNKQAMYSLTKLLCISDVYTTSIPSVPIMAAKMLKRVAGDLPPAAVLEVMNGQLANDPRARGDLAGFLDLQQCCLEALKDRSRLPIRETYEEGVVVFGGDVTFDIYSHDQAPTSPPDSLRLLQEAHSLLEGNPRSGDFETVPEAVLDFLITTLSPYSECFSHALLGLTASLDATRVNRWDLRLAGELFKSSDVPATCLEEILYRMEDTAELLTKEPELACLCFELIYRLCVSPVSSAVTLACLRSYDVLDADSVSEKFLSCCMNQCLDVMRRAPPKDSEDPNWVKSRTSCAICCGWLLRICALELRSLGVMRESGTLLPLHLEPYLDLYRVDLPYNGFNMNFLEIILLNACVSEAALPESTTPLISRCLGAASIRYRIGRFGAEEEKLIPAGSPGSFTTIDKRAFIKQFFAEVNENDFQAKADEYRQGLSTLVRLNRRCREVAAAAHLAEAWKQYTTIFVTCHGAAVLRRDPEHSELDLRDYLSSLLMPVLLILRERGPELNMQVLENIAATLFILVRELCGLQRRFLRGSPLTLRAQAVLREEDCNALLGDLLTVILTSVTGFLQPQGESVKLRGFLYSSLSAILTGVCGFPSSLNAKLNIVESNNYKAQLDGIYECDTAERTGVVRLLESHATQLAEVIGRDICAAPLLWQLNACAALSNILSVSESSGVRAILQVLLQRGYIQQMLSVINFSGKCADGTNALGGQSDDDQDQRARREYFISIMALCTHLASAPDGTDALLQTGDILKRLNGSDIFKRAPPSLDSLGGLDAEKVVQTWTAQLLPVLRLLRVLAVMSPSRQVLQGIAEFILNNRESMLYILRLRLKTLTGLVLAEAVTCLLAVIASAPVAPLRRDPSPFIPGNAGSESSFGSVPSMYLWDNTFQSFGNTLLADLCDILRVVGGDPFPSELARKCGTSSTGAFWAHFIPAVGGATGWVESERHLSELCVYNAEEFKDLPRDWSAFDNIKLDLSLKIAVHISTLLRLRTHAVIEQAFASSRVAHTGALSSRGAPAVLSAVSAIDSEGVAIAFCKCSALSRACANMGMVPDTDGENVETGSVADMVSTTGSGASPGAVMQGFSRALTTVAENLATTLHDLTMTGSEWKPGVLEAVLNEAQVSGGGQRHSRQFINELGRVMRYKNQVSG